jgi:hypothetical protein
MTVRMPSTLGSANAACRSARRSLTGDELNSSMTSTLSPKAEREAESAQALLGQFAHFCTDDGQ